MAGKIWTVWLLDFAERIGGKLPTFIAMLATLKFSVVQLPSATSLSSCSACAGRKKKALTFGSVCGSTSAVREPEPVNQNFCHVRNLSTCLMAAWKQIIGSRSLLYTAREMENWPVSKMSQSISAKKKKKKG